MRTLRAGGSLLRPVRLYVWPEPTSAGVHKPVTDPRPTKTSASFEERLAEAKRRANPEPDPMQVAGSAFGQGTRLAIEVVAATLVGGFIGYWVDRWLGTSPWGLLVLFTLGLGTGFYNLVRVVNAEAAKVSQDELDALPKVPDDDDEER